MKTLFPFIISLVISFNSAFPQGTAINSTGATADSSAMLDVGSTTKGMLIPRMSESDKHAISNPATGLIIYQTDDTTGFWYYNSSEWVLLNAPAGSGSGGGYHYAGELYGGGIVVAVWNSTEGGAQHGLIVSLTNLSTGILWTTSDNYYTTVPAPGAKSTTDGLTNSNAIVAQAGAGTGYAAGLCRAYSGGGYNDWYLPATEELYLCYLQKAIIKFMLGDTDCFQTVKYWTSTEIDNGYVWLTNLSDGSLTSVAKYYNNSVHVRAVRRF